jgi:hypothetical protein
MSSTELDPEWMRETARITIANCQFLCLATSSPEGMPWASPLMFAVDNETRFYWTSALDARHSVNIDQNPLASLVVYDSRPEPGKAQAVYCEVEISALSGRDLQDGCDVFYGMRYPDPAERAEKGRKPTDFEAPSPRRLYRATPISPFSILDPNKHPIHGKLVDHRVDISSEANSLLGN